MTKEELIKDKKNKLKKTILFVLWSVVILKAMTINMYMFILAPLSVMGYLMFLRPYPTEKFSINYGEEDATLQSIIELLEQQSLKHEKSLVIYLKKDGKNEYIGTFNQYSFDVFFHTRVRKRAQIFHSKIQNILKGDKNGK